MTENRDDRRAFLRLAARCATGAAIAGGMGWLVLRDGQACEVRLPCHRCGQFERCDLEKAQEARRPQT